MSRLQPEATDLVFTGLGDHNRYNDDEEQDDDTCDQTHAHFHILPPHLLPHSVGAAAEAMGLVGQVVGLGLQVIQVLTALPDLLDVIVHDIDGVVDFRLQSLCPPISAASLSRVGVVWGVVVSHGGGYVWFCWGVGDVGSIGREYVMAVITEERVALRLLSGLTGR